MYNFHVKGWGFHLDVTFTMGIYSTLDQRFIVYFNLISVLTVYDRLAPPPPQSLTVTTRTQYYRISFHPYRNTRKSNLYQNYPPQLHNLILFRWSKDKMNMQFDNELCIEVLYFNLVKFCEEIHVYHIIQVLFHFFCFLYMYTCMIISY